jgi:hypothetical protein
MSIFDEINNAVNKITSSAVGGDSTIGIYEKDSQAGKTLQSAQALGEELRTKVGHKIVDISQIIPLKTMQFFANISKFAGGTLKESLESGKLSIPAPAPEAKTITEALAPQPFLSEVVESKVREIPVIGKIPGVAPVVGFLSELLLPPYGLGGKAKFAEKVAQTTEKGALEDLLKTGIKDITEKEADTLATKLAPITDKKIVEQELENFAKTKAGQVTPSIPKEKVTKEVKPEVAQAAKVETTALPETLGKEAVPGVAEPRLFQQKPQVETPAIEKAGKAGEETSFGSAYKQVYQKEGGGAIPPTNPTEIVFGIPEPKKIGAYQAFKEKVSNAWLATREFVENDWERVRRLVQRKDVKITESSDPYQAEILFHGRVAARVEEAKDIVKDIDRDILKVSKTLGIKDRQIIDDINQYLIARHAPERNAALGEKAAGITTSEAKAVVSKIESSPQGKEVVRIANRLQELNNKTLDVLLEGEVIDKKLYDTLRNKYKNHVPLNRVFEDTEDIGQVIAGRPFDVRNTGILRARGSEREIADVFTNIVTNYEQAIIRAEKNRVDLATLKFARDNKHLGIFEEVRPPRIPVAKITHREAIDVEFFDKVINFAKSLGAKVRTKPREVLAHEVGHFFDEKFGLKRRFFKRGKSKEVAEEMINWMKEIGEPESRIRKVEERFADSFEWWLTNRALAEEGLPLFSKEVKKIIQEIPELKPLLDIKPSGRFTVQGIQEVIFRPSVDKLLNDPTILPLREKGKPVFLKINDPHLALTLRGVNRYKVDGVMRMVQAITRFYSGLATRFNPEFSFPNKIRDLQEAVIYAASKGEFGFSGATKVVGRELRLQNERAILDYIRGVDSEGARLYRQMRMDGGTTGGLGLSTRARVELDIQKIRELNRSNPKKAVEAIISGIDNWNTIFEDSTRLSVYREALARGLSRERAAVLAKEASINFNKFGRGGPVINALYMFSNASIQGSVKMLRAMRNPKVAGAIITSIVVANAVVDEWNDRVDPDWRDKVSKWDRMNSLIVMYPKSDGGATYIAIPVAWGIKPIKVTSDYALDAMSGRASGIKDVMSGVLASIIEGYNPIGGTDVTSAITPTALDLPVDIARNRAWSGNKIRPDWDQNAPASIQYFSDLKDTVTGKTFIAVTKGLSGVGIEVSPADINYGYEQIIGGAGRTVSKIINTITSIGKGEMPPTREIPIVSRFLRTKTQEQVGAGSKDFEDIKKILGEQSRARFILKQQAEDSYNQLKNLPREQAAQMFDQIIRDDPQLAKKINEIIEDEKLGLTYTDRLIKQLGVENGERAKFIVKKLNEKKTNQEKAALFDEYVKKKIITKRVANQIYQMININPYQ